MRESVRVCGGGKDVVTLVLKDQERLKGPFEIYPTGSLVITWLPTLTIGCRHVK